jgi:hypothetical protein
MTIHVTSILSSLTKTTSLCLGLLAVAQLSAYASARIAEDSQHSQRHLRELVSVADGHTAIDNSGGYFIPPDDTRPLPDTGTGSVGRGGSCNPAVETTAFAVLGPESISGLTTLAKPKFGWYISPSAEGALVVFDLLQVEENGRETPIYSKEFTAQPGFMSHQLPSDAPALEEGKNYLWEVSVFCKNNDILTGTLSIQVTSPSADLATQLSTATTDAERAIIYGQAGLWYDAFAQVISSTNPSDSEARAGLLQDLANVEADNQPLSTVLLAIVEAVDAR